MAQSIFSFVRARYALAAAALFVVEVVIALFVRDRFVRPYLGDTLAVVLVYLVLRAATPLGVYAAALAALAIGFAVEIAQWFDLIGRFGLGGSRVAQTLLGTSFAVEDLIAYSAGAGLVLAVEVILRHRSD